MGRIYLVIFYSRCLFSCLFLCIAIFFFSYSICCHFLSFYFNHCHFLFLLCFCSLPFHFLYFFYSHFLYFSSIQSHFLYFSPITIFFTFSAIHIHSLYFFHVFLYHEEGRGYEEVTLNRTEGHETEVIGFLSLFSAREILVIVH